MRDGTRVVTAGGPLPAEVLDGLVALVRRTGRPVVGVRPVTDTVKRLDRAGGVTATLDRDALRDPVGPVVLPGEHPAGRSPSTDLASVLRIVLAEDHDLVEVPAPG